MAKELAEGDPAPEFELPTDGEGRARLSDLRGKPAVIYFYPKDDTSGCTAEAIAFNALRAKFAAAGTTVIGVSPDSAASHDKFKRKHELKIALAADPERSAIEAYGVWKEKSMYGRKYFGVERSTFLIDRNGRAGQGLAQGEGPGPRRGGSGGGQGALTGLGLGDACSERRRSAKKGRPWAARNAETLAFTLRSTASASFAASPQSQDLRSRAASSPRSQAREWRPRTPDRRQTPRRSPPGTG